MTRHKHLKLDQRKIDRARRFLRVKTESEAVDRALDFLLAEEQIVDTLRSVKGVGGIVDPFAPRRRR